MSDVLLHALMLVTLGLVAVLLLRRPVCRLSGAGAAFTLWALPFLLIAAPWLPLSWYAATPVWLSHALISSNATTTATLAATTHVDLPWSWLPPALTVVWLLGVLIALIRLGVRQQHLHRSLQPLPPDLLAGLCDVCPPAQQKRLRLHAHGPAVACALRTRILLPADFLTRFDARVQRIVLEHEFTHAKRGDAWWLLAAELGRALLWFHPLVWWAWSRFRLDMELACDEHVLRSYVGERSAYGRALLDTVAAMPQTALVPWLSMPQLTARITQIASTAPGRWRRGTGLTLVVAMLVTGLGVGNAVLAMPASAKLSVQQLNHATGIYVGAGGRHAVTVYPPQGNVKLRRMRPPLGNHHGEHGTVTVELTVGAQGQVTGASVDPNATTAPADLQQAALRSARNWTFRPRMKDGKAVGGSTRIRLDFAAASHEIPCPKLSSSRHCFQIDPGTKHPQDPPAGD